MDSLAARLFRPLAEQGDALAQFGLGLMYRDGKGVPQDTQEAVKWVRKAAEQGDAQAQFNLGLMYSNGQVCRRTSFARTCGTSSLPQR